MLPEFAPLRQAEAEHDRWMEIVLRNPDIRNSKYERDRLVRFICQQEQKIAVRCVKQRWSNVVHLPPWESGTENLAIPPIIPEKFDALNDRMKQFIRYRRQYRTVTQLALATGAPEKLVEQYLDELDAGTSNEK